MKKKHRHTDDAILYKNMVAKDQPSFIKYLLGKGYSRATIVSAESNVSNFKKWLLKEQVDELGVGYSDVLHYIQYKRKSVTQNSIAHIKNSLTHYYNYLQDLNFIQDNPVEAIEVKGIKKRKLYHLYSHVALEKLYNDYRERNNTSISGKRNTMLLSMLVYQGLNSRALVNLQVADVKLREGEIYVSGTRTDNARVLKLASHQIMDLMEYTLQARQEILRQSNNKQTEAFFVTQSPTGNNIKNVLHKLSKQLKGLDNNFDCLHQIRTSVITHWLKLYNLREVQYMAGHKYVSSTESYLVNDLEDLQEDINKFHPL